MQCHELPLVAVRPEVLALIDALPEPRIVLDADFRILHANRAYLREFGRDAAAVRGQRCHGISHRTGVPCDQAGEACPLRRCRASGVPERALHRHHTPRGEEHIEVEVIPIRNAAGEVTCYVEGFRGIKHARAKVAAHGLVGRAPAFMAMLDLVARAAPAEIAVLLLGETGTGKELVARAIHESSPRAAGPFVAVDCAGLTETLFESELFGYEKGAFTGANFRKIGLVEAAAGGTLFLDEIGDMPLALQVKLLRLLETGTFRRVGSVETLPANFRLVCATHCDLAALVAAGDFRRDLYFRISAFPIRTPSLAERRDDIALLAESLLVRLAPRRKLQFSGAAMDQLVAMDWSGNVRELRNVVERACVLCSDEVIGPEHLPAVQLGRGVAPPPPPAAIELVSLEEAERRYVVWAARHFQGERRELAARLGISERTLYRRLGSNDEGGARQGELAA
ncbi:MAG: sigma-54-dependent Fis family transcriptional regulator [Burkholderiaceae bacterium]